MTYTYFITLAESDSDLRTVYFELLDSSGEPANVATDSDNLQVSFDNGEQYFTREGDWLQCGTGDGMYRYTFSTGEVSGVQGKNLLLRFKEFGLPTKVMPVMLREATAGGGGGDNTEVLGAIADMQADVDTLQISVNDVGSDVSSIAATLAGMSPMLEALYRIGVGRWKIQGTQLLIYDEDNTSVLLSFNLKDDVGAPTSTRIFERAPVP